LTAAVLQGGRDIQEMAVRLAPVDTGDLESSIKLRKGSMTGANFKVSIVVDGPANKYALWMHEGYYHLGPKSQAKADATGDSVGRGYLRRAYERLMKGIVANVRAGLRDSTPNAVKRSKK
jgi:hypothetical protein